MHSNFILNSSNLKACFDFRTTTKECTWLSFKQHIFQSTQHILHLQIALGSQQISTAPIRIRWNCMPSTSKRWLKPCLQPWLGPLFHHWPAMQPPESGALLGTVFFCRPWEQQIWSSNNNNRINNFVHQCRSLNHRAAFGYFSKFGTLISLKRLVYVDENHGLMGPKRSELRQSL